MDHPIANLDNTASAQDDQLNRLQARQASAAVLVQARHFSIRSVELPSLKPNQVLVQLHGCGVCGSNLPVWEGKPWFHYPQEPGAPGHEGWGIVADVGQRVSETLLGQPVACLSYHAFAEYDTADVDHIAILPSRLAEIPFPAEPLACAINVLHRCRFQRGDSIAVIGVGFLGALIIRLAVQAGADVTAISRRPFALSIAEASGAKKCIQFRGDGPLPQAENGMFSCVIECTGAQAALDLATELVCVRGQLVIAGYHQDNLRQVNMQQWNWKGIDVTSAHERDASIYIEGMREAVYAVATGALRFDDLITHQFSLTEIDQAFSMACQRPDKFLKAVIVNSKLGG